MNAAEIRRLIAKKSGRQPLRYARSALSGIEELLASPDIFEYVQVCLPKEIYCASNVRILPLERILGEMGEAANPGSFIRPFGYLVVGTSVAGNAVCFHSPSGKVFWAGHDTYSEPLISFKNRDTGEWEELFEYTAENVRRAMVHLSDSVESFLKDLLADRLTARFEALD